jgi:hypothetical protein
VRIFFAVYRSAKTNELGPDRESWEAAADELRGHGFKQNVPCGGFWQWSHEDGRYAEIHSA